MVEPGGRALQVPLADHRRLVAGLLQELRERDLGAVEHVGVVAHAVQVAVLAGQDHRAAGAQIEFVTTALSKRIPPAASRSMFGVSLMADPYAPIAW